MKELELLIKARTLLYDILPPFSCDWTMEDVEIKNLIDEIDLYMKEKVRND